MIETAPGVTVVVQSQRPPKPRGDIVLIHGMESSGASGYMRSMSAAALEAGFAAHRFHMRGCGPGVPTALYHGGLTSDLLAFLQTIDRPAFLAGFSLGGNVALKLAGELGAERSLVDPRRVRRFGGDRFGRLRAPYSRAR
jgi:predicted alpha/beta-fold hydrolase